MRISLVLLLIALTLVIGFGLGGNRMSAWHLIGAAVMMLAALQLGYLVGALAVR